MPEGLAEKLRLLSRLDPIADVPQNLNHHGHAYENHTATSLNRPDESATANTKQDQQTTEHHDVGDAAHLCHRRQAGRSTAMRTVNRFVNGFDFQESFTAWAAASHNFVLKAVRSALITASRNGNREICEPSELSLLRLCGFAPKLSELRQV